MKNIFVDNQGSDEAPGTIDTPLRTLHEALKRCRKKEITGKQSILLRAGTHYLDKPLLLTSADQQLTICSYGDEKATISGGKKLHCEWKPWRNGIFVCELKEDIGFTQMFADGVRQVRCRWPNIGEKHPEQEEQKRGGYVVQSNHCRGYTSPLGAIEKGTTEPDPDTDSDMIYDSEPPRGIVYNPETFTDKRWNKPEEAVIHIFQGSLWGNMQWHLKSVDYENNRIWFGEGGHQMGAQWCTYGSGVDELSRYYVENVFEELDAPQEWYLDKHEQKLYWMPDEGVDPNNATIEVSQLKTLVSIEGKRLESVDDITYERIRFSHTETTFFEEYDIPSLGDWAVYRGGALRIEGSRRCTVKDCLFEGLGGNAIFANRFNRDLTVSGCTFRDVGDSGVLLVGDYYTTTGTQKHFPYECRIENNHFYDLGRYGKQTAAVYISRAKRITVGHNLIHDLPRAGICLGDGTWGGHVIEYNHIFDTCLETVDHGPFNAWGRDRYWSAVHGQYEMRRENCMVNGNPKSATMEPIILRHNFFVEEKGWGLDLDDGASNYDIYKNVCVGISMKMREGSYRSVHNNIWVDCQKPPHFGVGNKDNHDRYFNNITVMGTRYQRDPNGQLKKVKGNDGIYGFLFPPVNSPYLELADHNCFYNSLGYFIATSRERESEETQKLTLEQWQAMGFDRNSIFGDPLFVDPENNDYRVKPESPALKVGFKNFEMNTWGLLEGFPKIWDSEDNFKQRQSSSSMSAEISEDSSANVDELNCQI